MAKKSTMTPNSRKVLDFLKGNGVGVKFTTRDVQKALDFEKAGTVTGSVTGLVNKGYAVREKEMREVDGKQKEVSVFYLTQEGADFDPDAVVEDDE